LKLTKPSIMELRSLTPVLGRHAGDERVKNRILYSATGVCVLALLLASPFRNLHNLSVCFGDRQSVMDIPAPEMRLEVHLLALQVSLAILAVAALVLGAQETRMLRIAGAGAWSLVAWGGVLWDRWLGTFEGPDLRPPSIYACLLEARSEHTHSVLSNAPLVLAGLLAIWVLWTCRRSTVALTHTGS
jgi:hypothetical protein